MSRRTWLAAALASVAALAAPGAAAAPPAGFAKPGPREKCPVCGMFVAKYPDWLAGLTFVDGGREVFDGAKDLFRFLFDMRGFGSERRPADVAAIFVTDYYGLEPIDGRSAFYVVGSDVFGPMGKELVPFARRADAEGFLRDHGGRRVIVFDEVQRELPALAD